MISLVQRIYFGFTSVSAGYTLIRNSRRLQLYALLPFVLGLIFIFVTHRLSQEFLVPWLEGFYEQWLPLRPTAWWASWIKAMIGVLFFILRLLLEFVLAYIFVIVLAGPFYTLLAEQVFHMKNIHRPQQGFSLMIKMALWGLVKVMLFISLALICFIMSFFPPLNILAALTLFMAVAFDVSDYAFETGGESLRSSIRFMIEHLWEYVGLASALGLVALVPGLIFFLLPLFVCGATSMYIEIAYKK